MPCKRSFFTGHADGLHKMLVVRDQGRKGKTARSDLRRSTFGKRCSQLSASILYVDEEARKHLSNHLHSLVFDFDEVSTGDSILRDVLSRCLANLPSS